LKLGWAVFGVVLLVLGWWSMQPLPWSWWQTLLNPFCWSVAIVKEALEPWGFLFMLGGAVSAAYGLLSKKR